MFAPMNSISYSHQLIALAKRLLLLLVFFTLTRLLFFVYNFSAFKGNDFFQILKSFFFGVRFDMSVIYYINLPFILLSLLPFKFTRHNTFQISIKILFVLVNSLLLGLNIIDAGYFAVLKRRSGWDLLLMLFSNPETIGLLVGYILGYWHLVLFWFASILLLIKYYPVMKYYKLLSISNNILRISILSLVSLFILAGGFGVARGLEGKPLRLISANDYVKPKYTPLLINTPFSIVNTMGHQQLKNKEYMPYDEVEKIYSPIKEYKHIEPFKNRNVIIIILESFASEYVFGLKSDTVNFTPFLDSLISSGLICSNSVANSSNSRDAVPAIVAGIPSHKRIDFMGSRYSTNALRSLPIILKENGYQTSFFHGGHNGTMSFDKFSKLAGMDEYFGYDEFIEAQGEEGDDGGWGIYDTDFLNYMALQLDNFKEPFFTTLFTLSSHDPYPIPPKYKNKFPEGPLPILQSVAYTDYALRCFFDSIKHKPWYSNTLFVLVADHTSLSILPEYNTIKNSFSIPILFYAPNDKNLKGEFKGICQQTDIMPTVLDYLNYNKKFVAYGESIFSSDYRMAVNYRSNFNLIDSTYVLVFDEDRTNALYNYRADPLNKSDINHTIEEQAELENHLKAYIQDYEYRMIFNKLADTISISDIMTE
jgi:phosphoglycerol transferase MdoB-like AlkP superfamily enzyme